MREQFAREGYVQLRGLLSQEEIARIVRGIHDLFARSAASLGLTVGRRADGRVTDDVLFELFDHHRKTYIACLRSIQNLPDLFSFGCSPRLLEALRDIGLRQPVFSSRPIVTLSSKRTSQHIGHWKTPAHQDWRSIQGSLNSVVAWCSLFDVEPELGRLEVVPGSHKLGLLEVEPDEWYMRIPDRLIEGMGFVPVDTRAGDVLLFSTFLVHRSGTNLRDTHRYAIQTRYNDAAEPSYVTREYPTAYRSNSPVRDLLNPGFGTAADLASIFGGPET